jgi:hypothetical protein
LRTFREMDYCDFKRRSTLENRFGSHPNKRIMVKVLSLDIVAQGEYTSRQEDQG